LDGSQEPSAYGNRTESKEELGSVSHIISLKDSACDRNMRPPNWLVPTATFRKSDENYMRGVEKEGNTTSRVIQIFGEAYGELRRNEVRGT